MEEDSSLGWAPMAPEEMDFSAFSTTFPTDQFTADHTQQLEAAPAAVIAHVNNVATRAENTGPSP